MRKKILLLSLIVVGLLTFSFSNSTHLEKDKKYIYWGDKELTWEDFKGRGPGKSPYVALTSSAIKMEFSGTGNTLNFSIATIFDQKESWKKKGADDHVLKHEQVHFDITEYYSRLLRKELQETKFKKRETLSSEVQKIYAAQYKECGKFQDLYDKETDHSKKKEEQYRWNEKVAELLNATSNLNATDFSVDISYLK